MCFRRGQNRCLVGTITLGRGKRGIILVQWTTWPVVVAGTDQLFSGTPTVQKVSSLHISMYSSCLSLSFTLPCLTSFITLSFSAPSSIPYTSVPLTISLFSSFLLSNSIQVFVRSCKHSEELIQINQHLREQTTNINIL